MIGLLIILGVIIFGVGVVTILVLTIHWLSADKLYKIEEQELLDSEMNTWIVYIKFYKLFGIKFTKKLGPFKHFNSELKTKLYKLRKEQEEAKLKASLKPVIKL